MYIEKDRAKRRAEKRAAMTAAGGKSRYARKRAFLLADNRPADGQPDTGARWGFQVPEPKPWR